MTIQMKRSKQKRLRMRMKSLDQIAGHTFSWQQLPTIVVVVEFEFAAFVTREREVMVMKCSWTMKNLALEEKVLRKMNTQTSQEHCKVVEVDRNLRIV